MHTALACCVAVSVASLNADARSLACALPDPVTHIVMILASALPIPEAIKAAIVRTCFFIFVVSFFFKSVSRSQPDMRDRIRERATDREGKQTASQKRNAPAAWPGRE